MRGVFQDRDLKRWKKKLWTKVESSENVEMKMWFSPIFICMSDIIVVLDNNWPISMVLDFYYTYSFLIITH